MMPFVVHTMNRLTPSSHVVNQTPIVDALDWQSSPVGAYSVQTLAKPWALLIEMVFCTRIRSFVDLGLEFRVIHDRNSEQIDFVCDHSFVKVIYSRPTFFEEL
jgi:hypothetical protein